MKIFFYTLGCKVNQYESQEMAELFESLGFDDAKRHTVEANAKAMAVMDAKEKIADIIVSLVK